MTASRGPEAELFNRLTREPELLEFLVSRSLAGFWYWSLERPEQRWYSPRFIQFLGYSENEVDHCPNWWLERIEPEDRNRIEESLFRYREDPAYEFDRVVRYRHRDGHRLWARCQILTLNQSNQMLAIHTDLTRLKDLESRNLVLEESNEELTRFAHTASHDLRAPLRHIAGFVQLLESHLGNDLDPRSQEWFGHILAGVTRMRNLIDNLLELSKLGASTEPHQLLDLNEVVQEALDLLAHTLEETGAEVRYRSLPVILGERAQLVRLFQNLLSNSLKFVAATIPKIEIQALKQERDWKISVSDNGVGVAAEDQERIFLPFERLHSDREYGGTGIGLAICRRIVTQHGSRLWIESSKGEGSTFHFTLACAETELGL